MDQQKKHKREFQIALIGALSIEEIKTLKSTETIYGIVSAEYSNNTISIQVDEPANAFSIIASWLQTINADGDIFSVQRIDTYYTGYTHPLVKEIMKLK